jgi:hypothetical protein
MKELLEVEDIDKLPSKSLEKIKAIICGTHNGTCIDKYLEEGRYKDVNSGI